MAKRRNHKYFLEVGSLDLTWWPDLRWPCAEIFTKGTERMHEKVSTKRRSCAPPFLRYSRKPERVVKMTLTVMTLFGAEVKPDEWILGLTDKH